jgi:hypothetical protein
MPSESVPTTPVRRLEVGQGRKERRTIEVGVEEKRAEREKA